jgi:hypothetical protein
MRDWNSLVEQRLGNLKLPEAQREEVVAELAAHLEDLGEEKSEQEVFKQEPTATALYETTDWSRLTRNIQNAKQEPFFMNNRSRSFWLPALVTFFSMQISWAILVRTSLYERMSSSSVHPLFVFLGALPFFGALGAYLSRRGGGNRVVRMAVGVFPSVAMFCLMALIFPVGLLVDQPSVSAHWARICISILIAAVVSGLALLVGTLPFLGNSESQELLHQRNR